jgi:hypothetical protein
VRIVALHEIADRGRADLTANRIYLYENAFHSTCLQMWKNSPRNDVIFSLQIHHNRRDILIKHRKSEIESPIKTEKNIQIDIFRC